MTSAFRWPLKEIELETADGPRAIYIRKLTARSVLDNLFGEDIDEKDQPAIMRQSMKICAAALCEKDGTPLLNGNAESLEEWPAEIVIDLAGQIAEYVGAKETAQDKAKNLPKRRRGKRPTR